MKLSWYDLKMSIAGAKLSHLVQKDKIWDHGSMIEQVKTIFFKLQRAKSAGQIDDLEKYLTTTCFEKIKKEKHALELKDKTWIIKNPVINEVAIINVHPTKNNRPDRFTALIKGRAIKLIADKDQQKEFIDYSTHIRDLKERWSFVRHGEWWLLDETGV